jgi:hypothetical protein
LQKFFKNLLIFMENCVIFKKVEVFQERVFQSIPLPTSSSNLSQTIPVPKTVKYFRSSSNSGSGIGTGGIGNTGLLGPSPGRAEPASKFAGPGQKSLSPGRAVKV